MDTNDKLRALRTMLKEHKLDGYIQPLADEYMNEYPPACARRVEWLAGFTGSAGTVVVTTGKAAFFTDGRYTLQAQAEIDASLFALYNSADMTPEAWIATQEDVRLIGYDPRLFTASGVARMERALEKKGMALRPCANLVDAIWQGRPAAPASAIRIHEERYHGEASDSKRARIAKSIAQAGADMAVLSSPDSVCWLLNIRGADVENTPFVLAPAIIDGKGHVQLFVSPQRVDSALAAHLGNAVSVAPPEALADTLKDIGHGKLRVLCDPQTLPVWYTQQLKDAGAVVIEGQDPCTLPKATKNAVELESIRKAHLRDGVAVIRLLAWLDRAAENSSVTEMDVCAKLQALRAEVAGFHEPSFNTIAGSGANGAIVHYRATEKTNRTLRRGELFLLDSGGQYPDGTTDITRTVAIGAPDAEQKDRFTRVLKGHIALATAVFPEGTAGSQLDALARQYLWQAGLDYDHGTGHGVGQFLSVHEGPQRISKRGGAAALQPGMVISNEPGYYKTGEYGIRIENLVAVREFRSSEGRKFFDFETLTCVPIDTRLVDHALMTPQECDWLNAYHAWVLEKQLPALSGSEAQWLRERCQPIHPA